MKAVLITPSASPDAITVLRAMMAQGAAACLITQGPVDGAPQDIRRGLAGHMRIDNLMDVDQIEAACRQLQATVGPIDRLLAFAEVLQVQVAIVRDRMHVEGLGETVARSFRDKFLMKEILRRHGLPVARQALVTRAEDARAFAAQVGWPIILKPTSGVGSQGTFRVVDEASLAHAMAALSPSSARPAQAEEFITGEERTFESVLIDGEPVWWSSTLYLDRPLSVLENPWMQWTVLFPREVLDEAGRAFLPLHVAALRALGLRTGIAHMEWFIRPDGTPVISEVGARPPGARFMNMIGQTCDADMWARWVQLELTGRFTPVPERAWAVGCAFFRAQGRGERIVAIDGLHEAHKAVGHLVIDRNLPQIGARPRPSYEGDGQAVVRHESTSVVRQALRALITNVRVRLG